MLRAAAFIALFIGLSAIAVSIGLEHTQAPERLDAEVYRESIRAIEIVLYRSTPPDVGDGDRVSDALLRLAEALAPPGAAFPARQRALRLYQLIGLASGMGDAGYALPGLALFRGAWERQRDSLFAPAPWFARSDAPLTPEQTPRPAAVDPVCDLEAQNAADRAQIERWNSWARSWSARLDDALRELPPAPPLDAELALVLAHQNTAQAANELRLVPQGAGDWPTPFRQQWESRFNIARRLLAERRAALANTPD
jgi:hypothetical protein